MALDKIVISQADLLSEINAWHQRYLNSFLDETGFQQEYQDPDILGDPDISQDLTRKYTTLLITIRNYLSLDDLVTEVDNFDGRQLESYQDHRWILRHLLDCFLDKIEEFYNNYVDLGDDHVIVTSTLTCATYAGYNKVKNYLTPEARNKFYHDLGNDLDKRLIEPLLSSRYYHNLHHTRWEMWYHRTFPSSSPRKILQSAHLSILKDPVILSRFYLQHNAPSEMIETSTIKKKQARRKKRRRNNRR